MPASLEQLLVGALLDDLAVLHHQDHVGIPDRGEPVGDDEAGPIGPQRRHGMLHQHFGSGVDRAGRLVQDQQCRIGQECPGDGDQLLLAGADIAGFLIQHSVIAVRQRMHEAINIGRLGSGMDLLFGGRRPTVGDVLSDGAVEQPGVLQHHADVGPAGLTGARWQCLLRRE